MSIDEPEEFPTLLSDEFNRLIADIDGRTLVDTPQLYYCLNCSTVSDYGHPFCQNCDIKHDQDNL